MVFLVSCSKKIEDTQTNPVDNTKMEVVKDVNLNIITSNKLLYSMIKSIVKDRHSVEYMFSNRQDELNFQFSSDSLNNIAKKDLFIYMGAGFDPWMNNFIDNLNKSNVGVINVSRGVKLVSYNKVVKYKDIVLKDNPYYLLNMDNYRIALMNIKNAVQDKDPKNRDIYEKNFSETLRNVDNYQKDLKAVKDKLSDYTFVTMEDELSYFIKYNDFKVIDLSKEQATIDNNTKLNMQAKLKDNKNLILLYNDSSLLRTYEDLIKNYNIKPVGIKVYNGEDSYEDVLKYNIENLEGFYEKEVNKK
ncbi:metal ABC transporter substrate-binding protein [Clostridium aciditolerans]|uniref:Metal ABC transporter substrate-binding protein n=1 Tax=Clostridium aciditolerans TaxID=339861 RepID=A0A934HRW2_9CLOT|nr:zinc ABC transporter substrate-binding protein [Clostridium aciditolerans]MBI6873185.1 metal ABC transporter substrate-binding protein [Clostridium aciditolerans]